MDENDGIIAFQDQIILLDSKWSDTRGHTSNIQLVSDDDGGHPLRDFKKGTRFHIVMVELADDEEPIDQKLKKKLEKELKESNKGGKHSNNCGMLCKTRDFHRYLKSMGRILRHWDEKTREKMARQYVLDMLKIKSRAQIDHDKTTIASYNNLIVDPYYKWLRENPGKQDG